MVTSICLPGLDGVELIRCLRRNDATRGVPVIVVTGLGTTVVRMRAEEAGCAAFLPKPCDFAAIARTIRSVLGRTGHPSSQIG